jgi:hypothetical protein
MAPTRPRYPLFGVMTGTTLDGLSGMDNGASENPGQCKNNFRRIRIDQDE